MMMAIRRRPQRLKPNSTQLPESEPNTLRYCPERDRGNWGAKGIGLVAPFAKRRRHRDGTAVASTERGRLRKMPSPTRVGKGPLT